MGSIRSQMSGSKLSRASKFTIFIWNGVLSLLLILKNKQNPAMSRNKIIIYSNQERTSNQEANQSHTFN